MTLLPPTLQQIDRTHVLCGGRSLLYFSGCDYLRLATDKTILRAIQSAIKHFGCNVSASRVTTGNHPLYLELESRLALFFGFPSATLVSSGYAANLIAVQALSGLCERVVIDDKAHSSLRLASKLLGVPCVSFAHLDHRDFENQMRDRKGVGTTLVLTDGVFSFSGAVPALHRYAECLREGDILLVDDAHGAGTLGDRGRGVLDSKPKLPGNSLTLTTTLSKSFGVYGGAILSSLLIQKRIHAHSHFFAGNTPLPLPMAAGALAALQVLDSRGGLLRQHLTANVSRVRTALQKEGLNVPNNPGPLIGLVPKSKPASVQFKKSLLASAIYPPLVIYPGGPAGGYYRFAFSSEHTFKQLDTLASVILRHKNGLDPIL